MMTDHADDVFRFPTDAADESVDALTLQEWARGLSEWDGPGYGGFEPGEVVLFEASRKLDRVKAVCGDDGKLRVEGSIPARTSRFVDAYDSYSQGPTLDDLGHGGYEPGDEADIICYRDFTEYWRCTGAKPHGGYPDTRDFEPATVIDYLRQYRERIDQQWAGGKGEKIKVRWAALSTVLTEAIDALQAKAESAS